jgi:type II secretion system protein N
MTLSRFRRVGEPGKNSARSSSKPGFRFYLGALASMLVGLVASLYFFFPVSALEERIEFEVNGRTPLETDLMSLSLGFPPALRAEKIDLKIDKPQPYALSLDDTSVKPLWHSLFGGNPGLVVDTRVLGGQGEGTIRRDGAMKVSLARVLFDTPLPSLTSLRLAGTLKEGKLAGAVPVKPATESHLQLDLEDVRITGLTSVGIGGDSLSLGAISLQAEGKGNSFRIDQLESRGGNLKVSGSGTVLLGRTVELSRLNLNVVLSPEQTLDKNIAELLNLFRQPGRDGSYRFRVTGTLANPAIK